MKLAQVAPRESTHMGIARVMIGYCTVQPKRCPRSRPSSRMNGCPSASHGPVRVPYLPSGAGPGGYPGGPRGLARMWRAHMLKWTMRSRATSNVTVHGNGKRVLCRCLILKLLCVRHVCVVEHTHTHKVLCIPSTPCLHLDLPRRACSIYQFHSPPSPIISFPRSSASVIERALVSINRVKSERACRK